jgi:hypothetical protein
VKRLTPLDAADLRTERPAATVKDFSPLDERERRRIMEEQPLVAVAGGGAEAPGAPPAARRGALAAVAASGSESNGQAGPPPAGAAHSHATPGPGPRRVDAPFGASFERTDGRPATGGVGRDVAAASRPDGGEAADAASAPDGDHPPPERAVREHGGAEDFRAVAPPVMSFAQGRRR